MATPTLLVYGDIGTAVAAAVESYLYRSSVDWMQCSKQAVLGIVSRYAQHYIASFIPTLTANLSKNQNPLLSFSSFPRFIIGSWKRRSRRCFKAFERLRQTLSEARWYYFSVCSQKPQSSVHWEPPPQQDRHGRSGQPTVLPQNRKKKLILFLFYLIKNGSLLPTLP